MAKLLEFTITPEGGEGQRLVASKLDAIVVERQLGAPIVARAQEGYYEPIMRLAYAAASRSKAIPEATTFEQFVDGWDVSVETEDGEQGN